TRQGSPCALDRGDRRGAGGFRGRGETIAGGGVRVDGTPFGPWLSRPSVSLAALKPAHGRVWRPFREPDPLRDRDGARGARGLARAAPADGAAFVHRLGGGWLDPRGKRGVVASSARSGC